MRPEGGPARGTVSVWIALGSNLGDREAMIAGAVAALSDLEGLEVVAVSPLVRTAPVGGPPGQGDYLNGCLEARTSLMPAELLAALQRIEAHFGRRRSVPDAPRTLDLDLLLFGDETIDEPDLVVPHPRMEERIFVLEPLAHLAPERVLPRSGRPVRERLAHLRERETRLREREVQQRERQAHLPAGEGEPSA